jgi:hypothetical protein
MTNQNDKKVMSESNIPLTASELGFLWAQYMNDTLDICVMNYFKNICEDKDILPLIENSLSIAKMTLELFQRFLRKKTTRSQWDLRTKMLI